MVNLPVYWRRINNRYNLVGTRCKTCNTKFFPPRALCPNCRRKGEIAEFKFCGKGKIATFTEVHVAPEGHEMKVPYHIAIIQLDEGPTVLAQLVNFKEPNMGDRVEVAFRRIREQSKEGIICYGYKFRPARTKYA